MCSTYLDCTMYIAYLIGPGLRPVGKDVLPNSNRHGVLGLQETGPQRSSGKKLHVSSPTCTCTAVIIIVKLHPVTHHIPSTHGNGVGNALF